MTIANEKAKEPTSSYELTFEPDGSSFTVRENLVDILERELLGPIHGPDEVLPFSPRSQYLVGYIAPVRPEIIDHDAVYEYRYVLVVGTLTEIRRQAMRHAPPEPKRPAPRRPAPSYPFS